MITVFHVNLDYQLNNCDFIPAVNKWTIYMDISSPSKHENFWEQTAKNGGE